MDLNYLCIWDRRSFKEMVVYKQNQLQVAIVTVEEQKLNNDDKRR